jgi:hypothetical protein
MTLVSAAILRRKVKPHQDAPVSAVPA